MFIPLATPISSASTLSAIRAAIAANAAPTPTPSSALATSTGNGSSWAVAKSSAATLTINIPPANGHFEPMWRPIVPASGPAKSIAIELGSRNRPASVALAPKP